jgi:hypothetical protein
MDWLSGLREKKPLRGGAKRDCKFKERERRSSILHSRHLFAYEDTRLVKAEGRFVFTDAEQPGDAGVLVAFDVMEQEYELFRYRQLNDGTFKMYPFHAGTETANARRWMIAKDKVSHRHKFSYFSQKGLVNLLALGLVMPCERTQECIRGELFRTGFMIGYQKSQRVNSVAVLVVDLLIFGSVLFLRGNEDSRTCDNALEAACHFRSTSFLPVWGSDTLLRQKWRSYKSNLVAQRTNTAMNFCRSS